MRNAMIKKGGSFLLFTLLIAIVHQSWVTLLQHYGTVDDTASVKEQLSFTEPPPPLVEWQDDTSVSEGIELKPLLEYVNASAGIPGPLYEPHTPDNLYLLITKKEDASSFSFIMSMNTYWKHPVSFRRRELTDGLNFLQSSIEERLQSNITAWMNIVSALDNNNSIPILINWDRSDNCTDEKYYCCDRPYDASGTIRLDDNKVPVMRYSAPWKCKYRLLIPTGDILKLVPSNKNPFNKKGKKNDFADDWTTRFQDQDKQHPWHEKIPRVVHRGSITLAIPEQRQEVQSILNNTPFDNLDYALSEEYDMANFQKYVAVLDINTLHYPQLLCQNSVLLKWDPPQCLDALWLQTKLEPWVHYIPVHNTTHLVQMAQFATGPANQQTVQTIIQNANKWCGTYIVKTQLQDIFLSTLSSYVDLLNRHNSEWQDNYDGKEDTHFEGHWLKSRSEAWTLPKHVVGAIKMGLRRDDPRYNISSGELDRRMTEEITSKWGK